MTKKKKPTLRSLKNAIKEYYELGYDNSTKVLLKIQESRPDWDIDLGEFSVAFKKIKEKFDSKEIEQIRQSYEDVELTDDEKEKTMELLKNPKLLELVKKELDRVIVGNDKKKVLLWMLTFSRYRKNPALILIIDDPSSGKSYMVKRVLKLFRKDYDYGLITTASQKSFYYFGKSEWENRIMFLMEFDALDDESIPIIRCWYSEGSEYGLEHRTVKDQKALKLKLGRPPCGIVTTTKRDIGEQLSDRSWRINIEKGLEQHIKIKYHEDKQRKKGKPEIVLDDRFQNIPLCLDMDLHVIIWFVDYVQFPFMNKERINRDIPRFYDLIELITLLHQHIRPQFEHNGTTYVLASLKDFIEALEYSKGTLETTLKGLDKDSEMVLNFIPTGSELTTLEIVQLVTFNYDKVYQILRQLRYAGIIGSNKKGRENLWFRVKDDLTFDEVCIKPDICSLIPKEIGESLTTTFDNLTVGTNIIDYFRSELKLSNVITGKGNIRKHTKGKKRRLNKNQSNIKPKKRIKIKQIGRSFDLGKELEKVAKVRGDPNVND